MPTFVSTVVSVVGLLMVSASSVFAHEGPLPSLATMLEAVTPGVVNISTTAPRRSTNPLIEEFFGVTPDRGAPSSLGSGVIIDAEQGLVVTNNHVIEQASSIQVTLSDGRELIARVLGTDPKADVALMQVEADNLHALQWADSDQLRVGDYCVAIGNPFGLGQTVTSGIISALGRSGLGIEDLEDFIQTDASINPGNSGGALVNLRGELIGINTAIVGPSGGNVGIGFAIPSNMALDIVEQLLEYGEVRRGILGIAAQALTPDLVKRYGIKRNYGVVIVKIEEDSPAQKAGLQIGDIIIAVDDKQVKTVDSVINRLGLVRLGEKISLRILRRNQELEIEATVEEVEGINPLLRGVTFEDARTQGGRPFLVISAVSPGSRVDQIGLQAGDILLSVNRKGVSNLAELKRYVDADDTEILLLVQRGRRTEYIRLR